MARQRKSSPPRAGRSVLVVGAGVIGSHLLPHLARDSNIACVTVVDFDTYTRANLTSQDIAPGDVGQPKALVQARRLRAIAGPRLRVVPIVADLADVPLGLMKADVCLGCLDSRRARRDLNRVCWRLGMAWIDAGVNASGSLARVSIYQPARAATCYECTWSDRDYELLEQRYACDGRATPTASVAPTGASSALGALAASMQAMECRKFFAGVNLPPAAGRQIVLDASSNRCDLTTLPLNPRCRFDHQVWEIIPAAQPRSVRELTATCSRILRARGEISLEVEEKSWVVRLVCRACTGERPAMCVNGRIPKREQACGRCGAQMLPLAIHLRPRVTLDQLNEWGPNRAVSALGLRIGDVVRVADARCGVHVLLGDPRRWRDPQTSRARDLNKNKNLSAPETRRRRLSKPAANRAVIETKALDPHSRGCLDSRPAKVKGVVRETR